VNRLQAFKPSSLQVEDIGGTGKPRMISPQFVVAFKRVDVSNLSTLSSS